MSGKFCRSAPLTCSGNKEPRANNCHRPRLTLIRHWPDSQWQIQGGAVGAIAPYWLIFFPRSRLFHCVHLRLMKTGLINCLPSSFFSKFLDPPLRTASSGSLIRHYVVMVTTVQICSKRLVHNYIGLQNVLT